MKDLFLKANQFTPGGVHSPVRTCSQVNAQPLFWSRSAGSYLFDIHGKQYLD